uniref:Chemosensory protein 7 n=1 Tax=Monochamus alternatus TaxID=192382 RepID=A0A1I9HZN4_MONAT|nr:chemosensory protein 7 [Monochamus alternatus]
MNELVYLAIFLSAAVVGEEMYSSKFDNIDYEEIIKSDRLLKNYANCLLDKGGCTAEATELKRILPDALKTDCAKCSERQKKGAKKIIQFLVNNKPDLWEQLMAKYDPDGEFKEKYEGDWLNED